MGDLQGISYSGQPVPDAFRAVEPPVAVLVDLAALFPREPHRRGGYHPAGLQMHKVVERAAVLLGSVRAGHLVGAGDLSGQLRRQQPAGDALGAGVGATPQGVSARGAHRLTE